MTNPHADNQPDWNGKRVLVSGGTGFIGSALTRRLIELNAHVGVLTRTQPTVKPVEWIKVDQEHSFPSEEIEQFRPNIVIHLATLFKADHEVSDIQPLIRSNIEFGTQLLESAERLGAVFVNISSSWQHFDGQAYSPVSLYAATKQAFLDIAHYYAEAGVDFRNLTVYDTYGPHDQRNKIVSQLLKAGFQGQGIDMGPGDQLINLLFVEDVISAILHIATLPQTTEPMALDYVVRTENSITIRDLVETIEQVIDSNLGARWGVRPSRPREMTTDWCFGRILPGWHQRFPLAEGIQICWQELSSAT
jgi:nucleoside-diphosphate-sugar epimerase